MLLKKLSKHFIYQKYNQEIKSLEKNKENKIN